MHWRLTMLNLYCVLLAVLAAPCFDRSFSLQVDASQVGAGAVLQQGDEEGVVRPVSFFLASLTHTN